MNPQTMNEAEELLVKAQSGELESKAFIQQLMEVTLFMPIYEKSTKLAVCNRRPATRPCR